MSKQSSSSKAQDVQAQDVEAPVTEAPAVEAQEQATETVDSIASALGASSKDVRRWIRATLRDAHGKAGAADILPGKGGRYAFTPSQAQALVSAYGARKASKGTTAPAVALLAALAPVAPAPVAQDDNGVTAPEGGAL